jgi:hypothetical protein
VASAEHPHYLGAGAVVVDCGCDASVRNFLYFMCDVVRPTYVSVFSEDTYKLVTL